MSRILLIDDDVNLLQMVKLMLKRVGHEIETTNKGEEGLRMATEMKPDLAIIDVMMPGLSGYDVVRSLRENPITAHIPIVILTARSQPMDKQMALEAGANAFLSKPVTAQELTSRVEAVLRAGVNYRVHTGLLTEPVHRPPSPAPSVPSPRPTPMPQPIGAADKAAPPGTSPKPPGHMPIGAEDLEKPSQPTPPAGHLPVMVIASLRGGTGSTTIAVNLAYLLAAAHGKRVCLVDLSTSSGHIPLQLHLTPTTNWGQLLTQGSAFDPRAITPLLVQHDATGIAVLTAPPVPSRAALSIQVIQGVLRELSGTYEHVIVDAPNLDTATEGALLVARSVIVVMSDDPPSIQTTGQFLITLQQLGIETGRVRVVLNHIRSARDVPAETIQKALKRPLSAEIPYERNQLNAIRRGMPLVGAQPDSAFAQTIQQIARTM
ncbi:MAG: response regulator [Anaerolineae bacterium]|nr:response regulator [Anaerolineae bacterium]